MRAARGLCSCRASGDGEPGRETQLCQGEDRPARFLNSMLGPSQVTVAGLEWSQNGLRSGSRSAPAGWGQI